MQLQLDCVICAKSATCTIVRITQFHLSRTIQMHSNKTRPTKCQLGYECVYTILIFTGRCCTKKSVSGETVSVI